MAKEYGERKIVGIGYFFSFNNVFKNLSSLNNIFLIFVSKKKNGIQHDAFKKRKTGIKVTIFNIENTIKDEGFGRMIFYFFEKTALIMPISKLKRASVMTFLSLKLVSLLPFLSYKIGNTI